MNADTSRESMPCGHPASALHHGAEGTAHCTACEAEARIRQADADAHRRACRDAASTPLDEEALEAAWRAFNHEQPTWRHTLEAAILAYLTHAGGTDAE
jgi:hypothetical protein